MEHKITVTISLSEYVKLLKNSEKFEFIMKLLDNEYISKSDIKILVNK